MRGSTASSQVASRLAGSPAPPIRRQNQNCVGVPAGISKAPDGEAVSSSTSTRSTRHVDATPVPSWPRRQRRRRPRGACSKRKVAFAPGLQDPGARSSSICTPHRRQVSLTLVRGGGGGGDSCCSRAAPSTHLFCAAAVALELQERIRVCAGARRARGVDVDDKRHEALRRIVGRC